MKNIQKNMLYNVFRRDETVHGLERFQVGDVSFHEDHPKLDQMGVRIYVTRG
jgi:hypothetical protein